MENIKNLFLDFKKMKAWKKCQIEAIKWAFSAKRKFRIFIALNSNDKG